MKYKANFFIAFSLLLSFSACQFQKIVKSGSVDEKYEAAVKLYTQKDYSRALQLFDQLTGAMRATDKSQKIAYYYSYCYYNQKRVRAQALLLPPQKSSDSHHNL